MMDIVSKTTEIRPGFVQTSYNRRGTRNILLLFDVKRGAELPHHKHVHHQFGYTFSGEYTFIIDDAHYHSGPRHSYLIEGDIYHSAIALSDYYSMDFKFTAQGRLTERVQFGLLPNTPRTNTERRDIPFHTDSGTVLVRHLHGGGVAPPFAGTELGERLLVVSRDGDVTINGTTEKFEAMKIYRLHTRDTLDVRLQSSDHEAFIYECTDCECV